ncbi:MAG: outer membrane beta-barrel protein [Bacteroidota bacterium]
MKKIVMSLVWAMVLGSVVHAQTEKGDWMVGGNMTINTTSGNSQFTLQPSAGYFFARNFVAGADFTLSLGKVDQTKTSAIGVGPFARYYFSLKNPDVKPFLHAEFSIASETRKYPTYKNSNTVTSFFIGGGLAYFVNRNVALEGVAGYNRSKIETLVPTNGFLFRLGFQVYLSGGEVTGR